MQHAFAAAWFLAAISTPASGAGLYAVWYSNNPAVLRLPYLSGGQVEVQWSDLQKAPATYDWSALDAAMANATVDVYTVQVDGGTKPGFLFTQVPYTPNWGNTQANDPLGVLMYWHPVYIQTYTAFVKALGAHLGASGYRQHILGLRMNFNAVGTEQTDPPPADQKASTWTVPPGVTNGPDWTPALRRDYEAAVIDAHVAGFGAGPSSIRLFTRITLDPAVLALPVAGQPPGFTYSSYFQQGKLGLLFTGGAPEFPLYQDSGALFAMDRSYAMTGLAESYSEPVSDSWGVAGAPNNPLARWCSPPQWNYWRVLSELYLGTSDIALYGDDLTVALSATHLGHAVGADYQTEFDQAFRFAWRHAGHHADPFNAPGAWIAFRQTITAFPASDYQQVADYTRFLALLNPQELAGLDARKDGTPVPAVANRTVAGVQSIGPYNSRFGAWARRLPDGRTALLALDGTFAASVQGLAGTELQVTYLDDAAGVSFTTAFGGQSVSTALTNTGTWKTAVFPVTSGLWADSNGAWIAIRAQGGPVTLHMVDIEKPNVALNAASLLAPLAPGGLFSIFGASLATATTAAGSAPWPAQLGGVSVSIGGLPAPLYYVSPSQINGQVPYAAAPCAEGATTCPAAMLVVSVNGEAQLAIQTGLASGAPGIFTFANGQAIAQNAGYSLNGADHPAAAGSVVTVYATGLGSVSNPPASGAAAPAAPLSWAVLPVTATVGGIPATVWFAGLTPGFVGLAQVNVEVPAGLPAGAWPLVIRAGALASNPATLTTE